MSKNPSAVEVAKSYRSTRRSNANFSGALFFPLTFAIFLLGASIGNSQNVLNPSFELNNVLLDGGVNASVTDWALTGSILTEIGQTENPSSAEYALAAGLTGTAPGMSGPQVLTFSTSLVGGSASATQTTSTLLALNKQYTLSVSVGSPANVVFQGYTLSIISGTTTLATTGPTYGVSSGTFATESLSLTTGTNYAAFVGAPLTVELSAPNAPGLLFGQIAGVDFDNVQLSIAAVPEPSTYGIFALTTIGSFVWRSKFKRRSV